MPEFFIPITFGKTSFKNHLVSTIIYDGENKQIITGALNGEIIIWNYCELSLTPKLHLSPHLLWSVGSVTCLCIVKRPFSEFQVCYFMLRGIFVKETQRNPCLLSVHQDKRIRLWNMQDGKTLLISDHDQFVQTKTITSVTPVGDRYCICSGGSNTLYIYDLWKMCCSRIFQLQETFEQPVFTTVNNTGKHEIGAISSRGLIYKIDTQLFHRPEKQEYLQYIDYKRTKKIEKKKTQSVKASIRMTSEYSLLGLPQKKVIDTHYNQVTKILVLVYSKQIAFVRGAYKEQERQKETIIMSCSTSIKKFKRIHSFQLQKQNLYMIQFCDGDLSFIFEKDIDHLLTLVVESRLSCISFGFGAFNFSKTGSKPIAQLTLNFQQVRGQPLPYFNQQDSLIFTQNSIQYLIQWKGSCYEIYELEQLLDMYPLLSICKTSEDSQQFWDVSLQSQSMQIQVYSKSSFIGENLKDELKLVSRTIELVDELRPILANPVNTMVQKSIMEEEITQSLLVVVQKDHFMYFIGTAQGKVLGYPFFQSNKSAYKVFSCQCSQFPITQLLFSKDTLFVQDIKNMLLVFDLKDYSIISQQNMIHNQLPIYSTIVQGSVLQVIKIRCLNPPLQTAQGTQPLFNPQEMFNLKNKFVKGLLALLLDDGSVFIYNPLSLSQKYVFPNVITNGKMNIYFHPLLMHYIIIQGQQASLWHELTGSLDRIVGLDTITPLFNLQLISQQAFEPLIEYNDFKAFQNIASSSSLYLDLIEFSYKSFTYQLNYRQELSSNSQSQQLNYESLSLLLRLKKQSLDLSEILNLLHHDSQNVVYKNKRSGIVIFQQQSKQIEKPFELHQIYQQGIDLQTRQRGFRVGLDFHRPNKLYKSNPSMNERNYIMINEEVNRLYHKYFTIWFDCKRNIEFVRSQLDQKKDLIEIPNFISFLQILQEDEMPMPVFQCSFGMQGTGESISRSLIPNVWRLSGGMTAQYSLASLLCLQTIKSKDPEWAIQTIINKLQESPLLPNPRFYNFNLKSKSYQVLSRYFLNSEIDQIQASCKLLHYCNRAKGQISIKQLQTLQRSSKEFLLYFQIHRNEQKCSPMEAICIIIQVFLGLSSIGGSNDDISQYVFQLLMEGIKYQFIVNMMKSQQDFFNQPRTLTLFCQVLTEGFQIFKQFFKHQNNTNHNNRNIKKPSSNFRNLLDPHTLLTTLIMDSYHQLHNTSKQQHQLFLNEYFEAHKSKKSKERSKIELIERFLALTPQIRYNLHKAMKQLIAKLASNYQDLFLDICNDMIDLHDQQFLITCTILDLMKVFCKVVAEQNFDDILALKIVQIGIRTQDQYHPTPKRFSYQSLINLLAKVQRLCKFVSLSRAGQKFAIALRGSVVLFDLRFGMKFAQIDRHQTEITCIALDYNAMNIACFSLRDSNIYIFSIKLTESLLESMESVCVKLIKSFTVLIGEDQEVAFKVKKEKFNLNWSEQNDSIILGWQDQKRNYSIQGERI